MLNNCFRVLPVNIRPYELCENLNQRQVSWISQNSDIIEKLPKLHQKIWKLLEMDSRSKEDSLKLCKKIEKLNQDTNVNKADPIDFLTFFLQRLDQPEQLPLSLKRYCMHLINQWILTDKKLIHESQFNALCHSLKNSPGLSLSDAVFQLEEEFGKELIIQSGEQEYKVCKAALATQSDYFRGLFDWPGEEKKVFELDLGDFDPKIIEAFFQVIHEQPVSLVPEDYEPFFSLCDRFLAPTIATYFFNDCIEALNKGKLGDRIDYVLRLGQNAPTIAKLLLQEKKMLKEA